MNTDSHLSENEGLSGHGEVSMSRRRFLWQAGEGLGAIALAWLLQQESASAATTGSSGPHFRPRASRVIQIFCCGGVSHLDTFDYKPELVRSDGKAMSGKGTVDTFFGQPGNLMKSPWQFRQRGKSGLWVSDLLPNLAECVDDMTFIHSMTSKTANHTPATFFMNSGFTLNGFPCLGAWLSYGLGTENQDLPAFVVIPDQRGVPAGGSINWTSGFLPATHQGTPFQAMGQPVLNLQPPPEITAAERHAGAAFLRQAEVTYAADHLGESAVAARIRAYELAARMQTSVPEATKWQDESEETKRLYGLDKPVTESFGRNCLLARRLIERGVRFVQLYHGGAFGSPRINWDAHEDIVQNHTDNALRMDRPLAGLLKDLKQRGLLEDTLLVWTTEFGRTPITQGIGTKGRDHHPHAFTCWMAGGGLKPGFAYGASDEVGYYVADGRAEVYDLHATILRLLGIDHKRLTYYHNGIQRRLTDVHGQVLDALMA